MSRLEPSDTEDALAHIPNRFALVNVIAKRARQLRNGAEPVVLDPRDVNHNCDAGTALREVRDRQIDLL